MYRLSDEVISQIAKLVQLAIITGTDIVDNLRMIRLASGEESESLFLTDDYKKLSDSQISKLLAELESDSSGEDQ